MYDADEAPVARQMRCERLRRHRGLPQPVIGGHEYSCARHEGLVERNCPTCDPVSYSVNYARHKR